MHNFTLPFYLFISRQLYILNSVSRSLIQVFLNQKSSLANSRFGQIIHNGYSNQYPFTPSILFHSKCLIYHCVNIASITEVDEHSADYVCPTTMKRNRSIVIPDAWAVQFCQQFFKVNCFTSKDCTHTDKDHSFKEKDYIYTRCIRSQFQFQFRPLATADKVSAELTD